MVFLPLIGAAVVMLIPKAQEELIKVVALGTTLVTAALGVFMLFDFDYGRSGDLQYVVDKEWINVINSRYILGVDGMSLPLIALTLLIVPLCLIYTFGHFPEPRNP